MYFLKQDVLPSQASSEATPVTDDGSTAGKHVTGLVAAPWRRVASEVVCTDNSKLLFWMSFHKRRGNYHLTHVIL